ncbi:MFS transporter [Roseibium sediminicola]|uniref:YbfB/YjiJ family MFS transporter n=1 Tax=Roseibium sediminicola TaxID=2933272 RepID=A0ABT0H0Q7_9HYPH|nr:MFS transporter [Roseibium sp. CAU 1639]MCK7615279.1 YbfB/YjiJ family MFS transporter [Roseibium sp. CAU 1639]
MTKHFTSSSPAGYEMSLARTRGLTAAGLAIVAATYGLARYCFGLFLPDIRLEFGLSSEMIGLIAGLSYMGYLAATFAGSWLSTVFEPRLPILLGGIAATTGMALIAWSPTPLALAVGVFIAGTSPGLAYPPFSDVIVRHTETGRQNVVYAWINSGTGFGVAFAGPLALYAGGDWRLAWLVFAGLALAITVWNGFALPRRSPHLETGPRKVSLWILMERSARTLFLSAFLFGIVSAIYWTYAVDLLTTLTGNPRDAVQFWIVLGIAGVTGCFAGGLVNRWGLGRAYLLLALLVGGAIGTLPLLVETKLGIFLSAACFGSGFIVMTALFGMWSMRIFRAAPSIGFGFTFFLLSLGQGVGPIVSGFLIPVTGQSALFFAAGLTCCALALVRTSAGTEAQA